MLQVRDSAHIKEDDNGEAELNLSGGDAHQPRRTGAGEEDEEEFFDLNDYTMPLFPATYCHIGQCVHRSPKDDSEVNGQIRVRQLSCLVCDCS